VSGIEPLRLFEDELLQVGEVANRVGDRAAEVVRGEDEVRQVGEVANRVGDRADEVTH